MPIGAAIMAFSALYNVGSSIYDKAKSKGDAEDALAKMEKYNRRRLENVATGLSIPTANIEIQKEQAAQEQANISNMFAQNQTTSVGGAMALAEKGRLTMRDIGSQLEESLFRLQQLRVEDEGRIRQMREQREVEDIAGLGAEYAYQRSKGAASTQNIIETVGSLGEYLSSGENGGNSQAFADRVDRRSQRLADRFERQSRRGI